MKHYVIVASDGNIWRAVSVMDDDQAPSGDGDTVIEVSEPVDVSTTKEGHAFRMVDGVPVMVDLRTEQQIAAAKWAHVRSRRDRLLSASDWVVLRAIETSTPVPTEWSAYRQALRDLTDEPDPDGLTWPQAPE